MQIYILSIIISIIFSIPIVFILIIFHLKSSLAKNYLMSPLFHMIFNFLLNYVLLFPQQRVRLYIYYLRYFEILQHRVGLSTIIYLFVLIYPYYLLFQSCIYKLAHVINTCLIYLFVLICHLPSILTLIIFSSCIY
jgi:hypothetical protein